RCSARYALEGAQVITLGGGTRRGAGTLSVWLRTLNALREEHQRWPFDVLHAFWATESGLLAAIAGKLLRAPTLVSLAGGELTKLRDIGYGDQLRAWERLKVAAALRLATSISAGSRYFVEHAQHFVGPSRTVRLLPLGVDTDRFSPQPLSQHDTVLLHVGSLVPVKDQTTLLTAFALLRQPSALHIVGEGPLRPALEHHALNLGINDRVSFRGPIDHPQLSAASQASTAFVISSRHEAQSMVALEAASCALPVAGTSVGVIPELGN